MTWSRNQKIGMITVYSLLGLAALTQQLFPKRLCIYQGLIVKTQRLECPAIEGYEFVESWIMNPSNNKYLRCYTQTFPPELKPDYCNNRSYMMINNLEDSFEIFNP